MRSSRLDFKRGQALIKLGLISIGILLVFTHEALSQHSSRSSIGNSIVKRAQRTASQHSTVQRGSLNQRQGYNAVRFVIQKANIQSKIQTQRPSSSFRPVAQPSAVSSTQSARSVLNKIQIQRKLNKAQSTPKAELKKPEAISTYEIAKNAIEKTHSEQSRNLAEDRKFTQKLNEKINRETAKAIETKFAFKQSFSIKTKDKKENAFDKQEQKLIAKFQKAQFKKFEKEKQSKKEKEQFFDKILISKNQLTKGLTKDFEKNDRDKKQNFGIQLAKADKVKADKAKDDKAKDDKAKDDKAKDDKAKDDKKKK